MFYFGKKVPPLQHPLLFAMIRPKYIQTRRFQSNRSRHRKARDNLTDNGYRKHRRQIFR